ncbi:hypothetical protein KBB96_18040 [Luteolibacter ambystomatis]|uniref:Uncharacterized protein n=1 Tax=Luteolibacter ambystomatis TaxID=2824561 RepID=A0A975G7H3_9BACT|nr:hypothetical protein [Luteolibacter ambystomatis]QUE50749.1 hypothetical protein KBB96_18040 [Luteolibacter ambystomatis]
MKRIEPPLVITKPCSANWDAMDGDERKRFCAQCGKHVFNLSAMTEREATDFAQETQGRECVAYVQADEGRIHSPNLFERKLLWLSARIPRIAAAMALVLPATLVSCMGRAVAGKVTAPPEQKQKGEVHRVVPGMPAAPKPSSVKTNAETEKPPADPFATGTSNSQGLFLGMPSPPAANKGAVIR